MESMMAGRITALNWNILTSIQVFEKQKCEQRARGRQSRSLRRSHHGVSHRRSTRARRSLSQRRGIAGAATLVIPSCRCDGC